MVFGAPSNWTWLEVGGLMITTRLAYAVGAHTLEVIANHNRWTAVLDGVALNRWFMSLADAWSAGVTEALRLDSGTACSFVDGADAGHPV
jgi:hypothetical protein